MKTEIINLLQTIQAFNGGNQGINARYVYRLLKVGRDYSKWIKARIEQAGFIENQDYITVQNSTIGLPKLANENPDYFLRDKMGEQKKAVRRNNLTARQLEKFPKDTFMKKFHVYSSIDENFNKPQALQSAVSFGMIPLQSQKTIASREKLTLLQAHSTPKACFFMRNIRTSQELADFVLFDLMILSMVGRNRQPLAVGCLPVMADSHPVTSYRPTVRSLAVVSENLLQETTQMYQFIFAAIRRTDLTNHIVKIRINADTEQEARKPLAREFVFVLAGRINLQNTVKTDRTFLTNGNNHSLPTVKNVAMISPQSQKTIAEPANSTYLQLAHSTPEACFFMRNIRTPKEFADFVFIHQIYKFLSMVACSGKGPSFAVFQLSQFCRPLHVTAKACKLSAVALKCLQLELLAMIYLFNAIKRMDFNNTELNIHTFPKSIIRVQAESLEQAKGLLSRDYFVINTGKIYPKTDRTLPATTSLSELPPAVDVKAESVKIHTLHESAKCE